MAPSVILDLGNTGLVSTTSGLHLRLSTRAQFAASEKDERPLQTRLTTTLTNTDGREKSWVCRANSYRLVLALCFDDTLGPVVKRNMIDTLSGRLNDSEMWHQLHLRPTSIEASSADANGTELITVHLAYDEDTVPTPRRLLHKLGRDVPFYDVQPPAGVEVCALEIVHLSLSVSIPKARKRRKLRKLATIMASSMPEAQAGEILMDEGFTSEYELLDLHTVAAEPDHPAGCLEDIGFDDELLLSAGFDVDDDAVDTTLIDTARPDHLLSQHVEEPVPVRKRALSPTFKKLEDESAAAREDVLQLIDAAIRLSIVDSPKRLSKAIRVTRSGSSERLADLAPALWSPNYLPAVSARAVFLPTISHALAGIGKHARSKNRLDDLCRSTNGELAFYESHRDVEQSIAVRLWQLLQTSCSDRDAARSLKAFTPTGPACGVASPEFFESLDENQALDDRIDDDENAHGWRSEDEWCQDIDDDLFDSAIFDGEEEEEVMLSEHECELGHRRGADRFTMPMTSKHSDGHAFDPFIQHSEDAGELYDHDSASEDALSVCDSVAWTSEAIDWAWQHEASFEDVRDRRSALGSSLEGLYTPEMLMI